MQALRSIGAAVTASALLALAPPPLPLYGYTAASSARERVDEARFRDLPSAQGALDHATIIGAHPHYAGTPADHALALYARDRLREYGFDARIETFVTQVDTPRKLALELYADGSMYVPRNGAHRQRGVAPVGLDLRETGDAADPATLDPAIGLPFNAGSADGDVVARLVNAHRGLPDDFNALRAANVDVHGAVVLIRYGAAFRGLLAGNAQRAGAAGVIFYTDPADDGAGKGNVYPRGPWRPGASVQRGWVGEGIRIPVLPIGADNASTLLRALARGRPHVHVVVALNRTRTTLWNTIGVLRGSLPTQSVMLGAHRDAWVYGVGDNGAGVSVLLETARGLGYLASSGRLPKRTVVVALWDGEEIGLRGSTAFALAHADELRRGCVAYFNADANVLGPAIGGSAVGGLWPLLTDAARAVPDPARENATVFERWTQTRGVDMHAPGGGSDHEPFLRRFGTPVAEIGFTGPLGPYHSSYDTLRYATAWSDPGFVLHRTTAQLYGIAAMRFANADSLPYAFTAYAGALDQRLNGLLARAERDHRTIDLAPIRSALEAFVAAAARADDGTAHGLGPAPAGALRAAQELDALMYGFDGYEPVAFPEVASAYASGDERALSAAILGARDAVVRATTALH